MKVLVACEYSGIVRDAFIRAGHDAVSCDLLPSDSDFGPHIQGDVTALDLSIYDLLIAHPTCTNLCVSGARWWAQKDPKDMQAAVDLFMFFVSAKVKYKAIENPIGRMSTIYRKPDQIIQPWQFGHGETKATCLWLFNLPLLKPTKIVDGREGRIHKLPPTADRWKLRSKTFPGVAEAIATQWGAHEG